MRRNDEGKVIANAKRKVNYSYLWLLLIILIAAFVMDFTVFANENKKNDSIFLFIGSNYSLVNGKVKNIDENVSVVPEAENGTTLVPIRFIAENFNYKVDWNQEKYEATITNGKKKVVIKPDSDIMLVDGKEVKLLRSAKIENQRTLVPVRAILEAFNKEVDYSKGLISISNSKDILKDKSFNDSVIREINILPVLSSKEELYKLLEESNQKLDDDMKYTFTYDMAISNGMASMDRVENSSMQAATNEENSTIKESSSDYSKTNVQVEGVDEADVIKTDGNYLYQVNNKGIKGNVIIFDISNPNDIKQISNYEFDEEITPNEIYIDGNKLIVIANGYERIKLDLNEVAKEYEAKGEKVSFDDDIEALRCGNRLIPYYSNRNFTKMYIIDMTDKSNLVLERTSEIEGTYVSSRKINDIVYLISNKTFRQRYEIMPLMYDSINDTTILNQNSNITVEKTLNVKEVDVNCIKCILPLDSKSYITVGAVNINDNKEMKVESYLGAGSNVYASLDSLYITSTKYGYQKESETERRNYTNTSVMKFSLDGENVTYINKVTVPGRIINQYSMDESNGYFRIATNETWNAFNGNRHSSGESNSVYIYDDFLTKVGELTEIAPDEQIYSTRFMGDRLYMVTFKTVDPLFVIDLSDPTSPEILGKLKIPGYSDYLHPYDENHIIGIGKDTEEVKGANYALYNGLKIALFDVSDVTNPVAKYTEFIGDRGTESELLRNPKALLFSKEKEIFALPVNLYEKDENSKSQYGTFSYQGMYVYKLNLEEGFKFLYRVTHMSDSDYKKAGYSYNYALAINRGIYVKDTLFTSSQSKIKSNNLYTGEEYDELSIVTSSNENKEIPKLWFN